MRRGRRHRRAPRGRSWRETSCIYPTCAPAIRSLDGGVTPSGTPKDRDLGEEKCSVGVERGGVEWETDVEGGLGHIGDVDGEDLRQEAVGTTRELALTSFLSWVSKLGRDLDCAFL
jgi:hypothetical protein